MIDYGKTYWSLNHNTLEENEIKADLKDQIPKEKFFTLSSKLYSVEKQKEEILSNFECYYNKENDALCIVLGEKIKYASLTKETLLKIVDFCLMIKAKSLSFLLCKGNKDYAKLLLALRTAGFELNKNVSKACIGGHAHRVLTMYMSKLDEEIEEVLF